MLRVLTAGRGGWLDLFAACAFLSTGTATAIRKSDAQPSAAGALGPLTRACLLQTVPPL